MSYRNSYVDGVPLYLNKKYYPIPRSKYKEVDCHIPLDALQDGYDFSLEKQALVECEQYEKEKKEQDQRREELRVRRELKAKEDAEAAAARAAALVREYEEQLAKQHQISVEMFATNQGQTVTEVLEEPEESPQVGSSSSASYTDENSGITVIHGETYKYSEPLNVNYPQMMQPELMKPYGPLSYTSTTTPFIPRAPMVPINLSEFESDTANPFDNVEMKSINEMAVLASVLQNNVTVSVPHNLSQSGGEQRVTSNMNVNVNSVNGVVHQPVSYYPYLSQSSPNTSSYNPHQWTPTTHNPFYSHFNPTMVTAATTMGGTVGSSDSIPQQMSSSSSGPIHRPNQLENHSSTAVQQSNQIHPTSNSSGENNFANYYFPFTSSQAQSRLNNHDREFS